MKDTLEYGGHDSNLIGSWLTTPVVHMELLINFYAYVSSG